MALQIQRYPMPQINAFHPDYVKTYMSHVLATIKNDAKKSETGRFHATKPKPEKKKKTAK